MAEITRDEALELLQGGEDDVAEWNRRREAGNQIPNLSGADFREAINLTQEQLDSACIYEGNPVLLLDGFNQPPSRPRPDDE